MVTWDGTTNASGVKIFKNGGEVSYATQQNGSGTRVSDDTRNFLLGSNSYNSTPFGGSLDEVRIYDRTLSSSDIQALYAYTGGSPNCNDTIDNDSDGRIDYPSDPGCTSSSDTDETDPPPPDTQAPTTPTNLQATAQSSSQINLSWTASTDNVGVVGAKIGSIVFQLAPSARSFTKTIYANCSPIQAFCQDQFPESL